MHLRRRAIAASSAVAGILAVGVIVGFAQGWGGPGSGDTSSSLRGCAADPASCGYPGDGNTGPRLAELVSVPKDLTAGAGWEWNPDRGAVVTTAAGAVMDGLDVAGGVVIDHPGATLSNSRVTSCGGPSDSDVVAIRYRPGSEYNGSGARVVDNELFGSPSGCERRARSGVRDTYGQAPDVFVSGNDISGTGNGITVEYQGLIENNWVHDLGHYPGDHHSGISTHGGAKDLRVRHNTVLLDGMESPGGGGVSAALTIYSDFGHAQNVLLADNLVSGGAYTVFAGNSGESFDPAAPATNIRILDNRFVCGAWEYGPIAFYEPAQGNEVSGNYCDQDGSPINL